MFNNFICQISLIVGALKSRHCFAINPVATKKDQLGSLLLGESCWACFGAFGVLFYLLLFICCCLSTYRTHCGLTSFVTLHLVWQWEVKAWWNMLMKNHELFRSFFSPQSICFCHLQVSFLGDLRALFSSCSFLAWWEWTQKAAMSDHDS